MPFMDRYVLAGHLASAYLLAGRRESLRLPCYWLGAQVGVTARLRRFTGTFQNLSDGWRPHLRRRRRPGDRIPGYARGARDPPERRPQRRRGRTATQKKAPDVRGRQPGSKPDDPYSHSAVTTLRILAHISSACSSHRLGRAEAVAVVLFDVHRRRRS